MQFNLLYINLDKTTPKEFWTKAGIIKSKLGKFTSSLNYVYKYCLISIAQFLRN